MFGADLDHEAVRLSRMSVAFQMISSGLLGAVTNTVAGALAAIVIIAITLIFSAAVTPPASSDEVAPIPDSPLLLLFLVPGVLIVPAAPIPGALAAIFGQWCRHHKRIKWVAAVLVGLVQVLVIFCVVGCVPLTWGMPVSFTWEMLVFYTYAFLIMFLPVMVAILLTAWLIPNWSRLDV